jgi:predicted enzyme related to lactoylglutathione lyase
MRFSGVMMGSEDPTALGAFYSRVLGAPQFHDGDWYGWSTGAHLMIGPHSEVQGRNTRPERIMLTLEVPDVAEAFAELKSHGATPVAEPYRPEDDDEGFWLATVEDPDGNYVQLATPWSNG